MLRGFFGKIPAIENVFYCKPGRCV